MSDLYSYSGKRVAVTGGASGVGAALVPLLETLGAAEVTILDRQEPVGLSASRKWIPTDLSDQAAVAKAADQLGAVDVLFNNAGVAGTTPPPVVFAVNVLAPRYLAETLSARIPAGGAIISTGSTAGNQWAKRADLIGEVLDLTEWDAALAWFNQRHDSLGIDPYSFTKECVQLYTQRQAVEFGKRGVRLNSVSPSPIDTPLLGAFRQSWGDAVIEFTTDASGGLVTPDQVAQSLAFLGMPAAARINGVNLLVDGGASAGFLTKTIDTSSVKS